MPIVNPISSEPGGMPWLSVGAHDEPTSPFPDQGDWQWCMMEVAAWMAGEAWSDDPANVSPVIAQLCKALNDTFTDTERQDLKTYLAVAPDGVIDTVSPGADETTRKYLSTNWLIRTYLPSWLDIAGLTDEADVLQALPAIAVGTVDDERRRRRCRWRGRWPGRSAITTGATRTG